MKSIQKDILFYLGEFFVMRSFVKNGVLLLIACLVVFLAEVKTSFASTASEVVQTKQNQLFELLKQSNSVNSKKVETLMGDLLNYNVLADESIGADQLAALSDSQKAEYRGLFEQLVRKAYERNLKKTLNFRIDYLGESNANGATIVKTKATSKTDLREVPVEIEFKMKESSGKWQINDIVTEQVSMVKGYRSQFTKIIKKEACKRRCLRAFLESLLKPKIVGRFRSKYACTYRSFSLAFR